MSSTLGTFQVPESERAQALGMLRSFGDMGLLFGAGTMGVLADASSIGAALAANGAFLAAATLNMHVFAHEPKSDEPPDPRLPS